MAVVAVFEAGLRLKTLIAGLKSLLRGRSPRVLRKYEFFGVSLERIEIHQGDSKRGLEGTYASSHTCLFSSACFARRSALVNFVLLGRGSKGVIEESLRQYEYDKANGSSITFIGSHLLWSHNHHPMHQGFSHSHPS